MHPFVPASTINDLANEHFGSRPRFQDQTTDRDLAGFFPEVDGYRPDHVYHAFHNLVNGGPFGALRRWIDRKLEEREERRCLVELPQDFTAVPHEDMEDDLAA